MKKRKAKVSTASQHPDSKGINPKRDATRAKGQGAATLTKGQGTGKFRRLRTGLE